MNKIQPGNIPLQLYDVMSIAGIDLLICDFCQPKDATRFSLCNKKFKYIVDVVKIQSLIKRLTNPMQMNGSQLKNLTYFCNTSKIGVLKLLSQYVQTLILMHSEEPSIWNLGIANIILGISSHKLKKITYSSRVAPYPITLAYYNGVGGDSGMVEYGQIHFDSKINNIFSEIKIFNTKADFLKDSQRIGIDRVFQRFPKLESVNVDLLQLEWPRLSTEIYPSLKQLISYESIEISYKLLKFPNLIELSVNCDDSVLFNSEIALLKKQGGQFPHLKKLTLNKAPFLKIDELLSIFPNLQELTFKAFWIKVGEDILSAVGKGSTSLEHLELPYVRDLSTEILDTLISRYPNLKSLGLRSNYSVPPVWGHPRLQKLKLKNFFLEKDSYGLIMDNYRNLTSLHLPGCSYAGNPYEVKKTFLQLKNLILIEQHFLKNNMLDCLLESVPNLTYLDIRSCTGLESFIIPQGCSVIY